MIYIKTFHKEIVLTHYGIIFCYWPFQCNCGTNISRSMMDGKFENVFRVQCFWR